MNGEGVESAFQGCRGLRGEASDFGGFGEDCSLLTGVRLERLHGSRVPESRERFQGVLAGGFRNEGDSRVAPED